MFKHLVKQIILDLSCRYQDHRLCLVTSSTLTLSQVQTASKLVLHSLTTTSLLTSKTTIARLANVGSRYLRCITSRIFHASLSTKQKTRPTLWMKNGETCKIKRQMSPAKRITATIKITQGRHGSKNRTQTHETQPRWRKSTSPTPKDPAKNWCLKKAKSKSSRQWRSPWEKLPNWPRRRLKKFSRTWWKWTNGARLNFKFKVKRRPQSALFSHNSQHKEPGPYHPFQVRETNPRQRKNPRKASGKSLYHPTP